MEKKTIIKYSDGYCTGMYLLGAGLSAAMIGSCLWAFPQVPILGICDVVAIGALILGAGRIILAKRYLKDQSGFSSLRAYEKSQGDPDA